MESNAQLQPENENQTERILTIDDFEWVGRKNEDYDKVKSFLKNKKNRILVDSALKAKLKQLLDTENHLWGQLDPIQVNIETNTLTDGHARASLFMHCVENNLISKTTKIPVEYIRLDPKLEKRYLWQKQYCRSWSSDDFITSNINDENKNYIDIDKFCREHPLCHVKNKQGKITRMRYRVAAAILCGVRKGVPLKDGTFKYPYENKFKAETIYGEIETIIKTIKIEPGNMCLESMCTAWCKTRDLASWDEWKKVFRKKKNKGGPKTNFHSVNETLWKSYFKECLGDIIEMRAETKDE